MRTLAPGWKSLDDLAVCWVHTPPPEREERERPEEVRGMHFNCLLPPETRRPSGPKDEEVRLPLLASMVVWRCCQRSEFRVQTQCIIVFEFEPWKMANGASRHLCPLFPLNMPTNSSKEHHLKHHAAQSRAA